ncbi:choice-of-anchor Q domain-containing protein [Luteimicrobium xylanilyticum]|uniref:choice-of-anchor Q domain-containing protein n=1 Tax=Luteimicrobium xylanilyticum TaxID=1133546 RepID=UPI001D159161|nr:choice-of-anchor Q domain-containing protein [Luteimicrobium xylanilyticum]
MTGSVASAAAICGAPARISLPSAHHVVGHGTAGSCTDDALRSAVANGGYITFDCGSHATIDVSPAITVNDTTVIDGGGKVTLDGLHKNRIVVADNGTTLSVRGLRFVNGAAAQSSDRGVGAGGAVAGQYKSRVEVIDSSFSGNSAGYGGGAVAVNTDSTLTIVGSTFDHNTSWEGGAVYSLLSPLTIMNSTFTSNSVVDKPHAGDGGAIATDGASPFTGGKLELCGLRIAHNTSEHNGGGAYLWTYAPDSIEIRKTTFEDNHARTSNGAGGAARVSVGDYQGRTVGQITISQTTVTSNTSGGNAGGFYLDCAPNCDINNTTFEGNSSATYGGAIFGDGHRDTNVTFANNTAEEQGGAIFGSNFTLNNTVLSGNTSGNQWHLAQACNNTGSGSNVVQWGSGGKDTSKDCAPQVIAKNPKLGKLAANGGPTATMMPAKNSAVLRAGQGCEATDQRGVARTAACDVGAVQRTGAPLRSGSSGSTTGSAEATSGGSGSAGAGTTGGGQAASGGHGSTKAGTGTSKPRTGAGSAATAKASPSPSATPSATPTPTPSASTSPTAATSAAASDVTADGTLGDGAALQASRQAGNATAGSALARHRALVAAVAALVAAGAGVAAWAAVRTRPQGRVHARGARR